MNDVASPSAGVDLTNLSVAEKIAAGTACFGRAVIILLIVASATCVGLALPYAMRDWIVELPPAGLAVGAAALLGVIRGLLESMPTAWDYIAKSSAGTIPKIFVQVSVASLGLGFAYYAAKPLTAPTESHGLLSLSVGGSLPPLVMNESDSLLTTYVVFPEKASKLDGDDAQIRMVDNLVDSLVTCLQAPADRINLLVRAYASSSGSDADNLALYRDRGDYLSKLITDRVTQLGKQSQFSLEVRKWPTLDAMKLRRLFTDTGPDGKYLESAGALNRRAEIKVRAAGSCLHD